MELKAETREKIHRCAREMGYARNEIARSMVTGRNDVIAFVSPDIGTWEYTGKVISGIMEEASRLDFAVKVYHLGHNTQGKIMRKLIEQRVAGIIFHSERNSDFDLVWDEAIKKHIPCATVVLSCTSAGIGVASDDFQGTRDAVKYLAGLGHRRIAYISNKFVREYSANRENGFIAGMKEYVTGSDGPQIAYGSNTEIDENQLLIRNILSESANKRPTAIICYSDYIACDVLQVAYQMEIKVPEDLSIIGFADLDIARHAVVPLTTVAQPFEQMGKETARVLIDSIKNKWPNILNKVENRKMEVKLVVRKSTAPPKIRVKVITKIKMKV